MRSHEEARASAAGQPKPKTLRCRYLERCLCLKSRSCDREKGASLLRQPRAPVGTVALPRRYGSN